MDFNPARLRLGEWIVGASGLVLLASMFLLDWYGLKTPFAQAYAVLGRPAGFDAWNALSNIRWLLLLCTLSAGTLVYFQATRRAPAIPVSLSVIVTTLGIVGLLALLYRVLIDIPGPSGLIEARVGAYVGLVSMIVLIYGGYRSMREEGIAPADAPSEIETIRLGDLEGS
jgi:hypothetical protein